MAGAGGTFQRTHQAQAGTCHEGLAEELVEEFLRFLALFGVLPEQLVRHLVWVFAFQPLADLLDGLGCLIGVNFGEVWGDVGPVPRANDSDLPLTQSRPA